MDRERLSHRGEPGKIMCEILDLILQTVIGEMIAASNVGLAVVSP